MPRYNYDRLSAQDQTFLSFVACPPFDGPAPFSYNSSTGRCNAIGATDLNSILFAYSTLGDAELLEGFGNHVPPLSDPTIVALVPALLAIGATCIRPRASAG